MKLKIDNKIRLLFFISIVILFIFTYQSFKKEKSSIVLEKEKLDYVPQFVLLSFDGSKSIEMWKDSRDFAKEMNASGTPIKFTYFINAVYFLTKETGNFYQGPNEVMGYTPIGFSESRKAVSDRVNQMNLAIKEGHEIGSHAAGHFTGRFWTKEDWRKEFNSFNNILFSTKERFPEVPTLSLKKEDIVGFRAPELSINENMYDVLKEFGFTYDTSGVNYKNEWPTKDKRGIWHIPLGMIYLNDGKTRTIAMDYNEWLYHSNAENVAVKGTPIWNKFYTDTLIGYLKYFEKNYSSNRAPIVIGHHFSSWNDGVYWEAEKEFARKVCGLPQVRCTTYKDFVNYLNEYGVPESK